MITASSLVAAYLAGTGSLDSTIHLRAAQFDPIISTPTPPVSLQARAESPVMLVQLQPGPVDGFLRALENLGGQDLGFVPDAARVVRIDPSLVKDLQALPQVRWVGPYHPWYKLAPELANGPDTTSDVHSILVWERGPAMQHRVAARIAELGGRVIRATPEGYRIAASLNAAQARELAGLDEIWFIDRPGPAGLDVNIALQIGGGSFVHNTLGMTGTGVRGEVMDTAVLFSHTEFAGHQTIQHGPVIPDLPWHGTRVFGLLFGKGTGNAQARGFLPDAQPIFAHLDPFFTGTANRYTHTAELVNPAGPYRAVFQSNSWGHSQTTAYTTISAEMDDILFINDIIVTQSQSNLANTNSRPESWAKNIVSVGGIVHWDTLTRSDDCWGCNNTGVPAASTGPASDGRIKPDLAHFYDRTLTTSDSCGTCYDPAFYGTSNASPLVAGHFGLLCQMWHEGAFAGFGGGASVFDSRPHMTTAKAMLINAAFRYDWALAGPNSDLTRLRQGWGMPDLKKLHDDRASLLIVNETSILLPQQTATYTFHVGPGASEIRATMTWADPRGNPAATVHRINDLSLKVTSPGGAVYWGNQGLNTSNISVAGGSADTINTVENVFLPNPGFGNWTIQVIATEINLDGHTETPGLDADFALVVARTGGGCYANCDGSSGSPLLTANDFQCFITTYILPLPYANCDGSTGTPTLTPNDFQCFINAFAAGCP